MRGATAQSKFRKKVQQNSGNLEASGCAGFKNPEVFRKIVHCFLLHNYSPLIYLCYMANTSDV